MEQERLSRRARGIDPVTLRFLETSDAHASGEREETAFNALRKEERVHGFYMSINLMSGG